MPRQKRLTRQQKIELTESMVREYVAQGQSLEEARISALSANRKGNEADPVVCRSEEYKG